MNKKHKNYEWIVAFAEGKEMNKFLVEMMQKVLESGA